MSTVIELTEAPDPARCCELLAGLPYRLFLDSATPATRLGRYSFLTADPVAIVQSKGARTEVHDARNGVRIVAGDALAQVGALLRAYRCDALEGLPPFQGGAAGYLAYDWGRVLERIPENRYEDLGLPDAAFGIYDWVIGWDHRASRAWLISTGIPEVDDAARARRADERAQAVVDILRVRSWARTLYSRRLQARQRRRSPLPSGPRPIASRRRRLVGSASRRPILLHT